MKHLTVSIYTAASMIGLLPIVDRDSYIKRIAYPASWTTSVCRVVVGCGAMQHNGSTIKIYEGFVQELMVAYHREAKLHSVPLMSGKAVIGAHVTIQNRLYDVIWRGPDANCEMSTAVAEITVDRVAKSIARIDVFAKDERYTLIHRGRYTDLNKDQIANLIAATAAAHKQASGEQLNEAMHTVGGFTKRTEVSPAIFDDSIHLTTQDLIHALLPEKRRAIVSALIAIPGPVNNNGYITVSPINWSDRQAAENFRVSEDVIRGMRQELGIEVTSVNDTLNSVMNALDDALKEVDKCSLPMSGSPAAKLRSAAQDILTLLRL